jgi:hypothetical protein
MRHFALKVSSAVTAWETYAGNEGLLKYISRKLDCVGSEYGPMMGFCEHGEKPSGSIRVENVMNTG